MGTAHVDAAHVSAAHVGTAHVAAAHVSATAVAATAVAAVLGLGRRWPEEQRGRSYGNAAEQGKEWPSHD